MLVHLSDFTNGELVSVEMRGKTAHYIWGNQEDYIQGNVWLNGEKIFGKDDMEIVGLFINAEPYYLSSRKTVPGIFSMVIECT